MTCQSFLFDTIWRVLIKFRFDSYMIMDSFVEVWVCLASSFAELFEDEGRKSNLSIICGVVVHDTFRLVLWMMFDPYSANINQDEYSTLCWLFSILRFPHKYFNRSIFMHILQTINKTFSWCNAQVIWVSLVQLA